MAETTTALPDVLLDHTSDYGDFGSDAEEIELLNELLAQTASENEQEQQSFVVTDIEDYEPPRGILLPQTITEARLPTSQTEVEAEFKVLRDVQAENSVCITSVVSRVC